MIDKTFEFVCHLPAEEASQRIEALLLKEGVEYAAANLSVVSERTPVAVLGIDPKLYTHNNWVGINPFAYVSGVDVRFRPSIGGDTIVIVRVNRARSFFFAALGIATGLLAACAMPQPAGVVFFVGFASAAWLGIVSFLGGYLIKSEIGRSLKTR